MAHKMNRVATPGYLRYPHIHGDLLVFVAEDDVWLAPAEGGRAWKLSADSAEASYPLFSRDGSRSPGPAREMATQRSIWPTPRAAPQAGSPTGVTTAPG